VAYGYATEEKVMVGWMNSPGHRANILGKQFDAMGAAVAWKGSTPYWTQDFGAGGDAGMSVNCQPYGMSIMMTTVKTKSKSFWHKGMRAIKRVGRKVFRIPPKRKNQSHWSSPPRRQQRVVRGRNEEFEEREEPRGNNNQRHWSPRNSNNNNNNRRDNVRQTFGRGGGGREENEERDGHDN